MCDIKPSAADSTETSTTSGHFCRDFGILFLSLCASYALGSVIAPHSMWTMREFDGVDRMFLAASEVALIFVVAGILALATVNTDRIRNPNLRKWLKPLPIGGVIVYLFSWLTLLSTGDFLSIQLIRYFLSSPWLVILHIVDQQPMLALGLLALVAVVSAVLSWVYVKKAWLQTHHWRVGLLAVPVLMLPMASLGHFWAAHDSELVRTEGGLLQPRGAAFASARINATGPLLYGFDGMLSLFTPDSSLMRADDVHVSKPAVVDLNEFVADNPIAKRYNVLIILVESLRPDQLKTFGGTRSVMPNLDALAASSYRFLRGYTQATSSNYADLCPLSSQYPLRSYNIEFYPKTLPYSRVMIYDLLKQYGYRTAVISSQNENWMGMINYLRSENLDHFYHSESYTGKTIGGDQYFDRWAKRNNLSGKIDDKLTVDEMIRWTGERTDTPFVIYANLQNSHVPYHVPDDYPRPFGPDSIDFPLRFGYFPKEKTAVVKDLYADSLNYVDAQLGRLFDGLRATGQFENTIICVSGDTGQAFYEHGVCNHGGPVYEEVVRVPIILKIPGESGGDRSDIVQHVDVPPTILGRLGLPPHPAHQGHDLFTQNSPGVAFLTSHLRTRQVGLVSGKYKLIFELGREKTLLFDLEADPGESVDLSHSLPKIAARLSGVLGMWYDQQLAYYGSPERMAREYAPRLIFPQEQNLDQH